MKTDILKGAWTPYIFGLTLVGSLYYINNSVIIGVAAYASFLILIGCSLVRLTEPVDDELREKLRKERDD